MGAQDEVERRNWFKFVRWRMIDSTLPAYCAKLRRDPLTSSATLWVLTVVLQIDFLTVLEIKLQLWQRYRYDEMLAIRSDEKLF